MSIKDPYIFKLRMNEHYDISGITLESHYIDKYSPEIIELAKNLKAKHEIAKQKGECSTDYSDDYYLDYAKSMRLQGFIGRGREVFKDAAAHLDIVDPDWAVYSYEEIIQMENDGFRIPDEVIKWAHARQQEDVTSYIVLAEEAEGENNTSTANITDNNDLSVLLSQAKQCISKAEKAKQTIKQNNADHKIKASKAEKIKKQKENKYKESANKVNESIKEWKKLDNKKKQGEKLSFGERMRYNHFSKMLDSKEGKLIKELKADSQILDEFLESISVMDSSIPDNKKVANETIKAGRELSQMDKNYCGEGKTFQSMFYKEADSLADEALGVSVDKIGELAVTTGSELESENQAVENTIAKDEKSGLTGFANDYTDVAKQTEEAIVGVGDDNSSSGRKDEENKKSFKGYKVARQFSYINSGIAAATTIVASTAALAHERVSSVTGKTLFREIKKSDKSTDRLSKLTSKFFKNQEERVAKEEEYSQQIEQIEAEKEAKVEDKKAKQEQKLAKQSEQKTEVVEKQEKQEAPAKAKQNKEPQEEETVETDENDSEVETIKGQVAAMEAQEDKESSELKKSATHKLAENSKLKELSTRLTGQNRELDQRSKNLAKVSKDTMFVGQGTVAKSVISTAIGTSLFSAGSAMLPVPYTHAQGLILTAQGIAFQDLGIKEALYGNLAMATSLVGSSVAIATNSKSSELSALLKTGKQSFKFAQNAVKETGLVQVNNNSGVNEGSEQTQNAEGQEAEQDNAVEKSDKASTNLETEDVAENKLTDLSENENIDEAVAAVEIGQAENSELAEESSLAQTPVAESEDPAELFENIEETDQTEETRNTEKLENTDDTDDTDKTEATEETNQTEVTESTEGTSSEETTDESEEEAEAVKGKKYDVSMEYTAENSVAATITTIKATNEMLTEATGVDKQIKKVEDFVKRSGKIAKEAERDAEKLNAEKARIAEEQDEKIEEVKTAQEDLANAQTQEEITEATGKVQTAQGELEQTEDADEKPLDNTVANGNSELEKFKNSEKELKTQTRSLDQIMSEQLNVSNKTTAVGVGTTAKGVFHTISGTNQIALGTTLLPNPYTHTLGVITIAAGTVLTTLGINETTTGTLATATGINGIVTNVATDSVLRLAGVTSNNADKSYDKISNEISKKSETKEGNKTEDVAIEPVAEKTAEDENVDDTTEKTSEEGVESSENAQETNETENTEETNKNESEENKTEEGKESSGSQYTIVNSLKTGQDANNSTAALLLASANVKNVTDKIEKEVKRSTDLTKKVEQEALEITQAKQKAENNAEKLGNELASEKQEAVTAKSDEALDKAQNKMSATLTKLENLSDVDKAPFGKTLNSNLSKLLGYQKNTKILGADADTLKMLDSEQINASKKAINVGTGTSALGALDTTIGTTEIAVGTALLSNPFTHAIGVLTIAQGTFTLGKGVNETAAGGFALGAGTNGLITNLAIKTVEATANATEKVAELTYKGIEKNIEGSSKVVQEISKISKNTAKAIVPGVDLKKNSSKSNAVRNTDRNEEDETAIAGSVSANANLNAYNDTNDKTERKLVRFNLDSMIESKKRNQKVLQIFASSRNRR